MLAAPWLAREFDMRIVVTIRHPAAYAASMRRLGWTHDFSGFLAQPGLVDDLVPGLGDDIAAMARRPGDILDEAALLWNVIHTVIAGYRRDLPTGSSSAMRTSPPPRSPDFTTSRTVSASSFTAEVRRMWPT